MSEASNKTQGVRLAVWQGRCVDGDLETNLAAAHRALAAAGEERADFLCLPETFLSGYGSRATIEQGVLALDDPRLSDLAAAADARDLVLLVGLTERLSDGALGNTMAIFWEGRRLGLYRKTMLTGGDARDMGYCRDYDLPVFQAKGVTFGCIICHDSSFFEPAAVLVYRGAQVIFSPHYNAIGAAGMDEHRIRVRNNHVGLATLLGVYVARANVVGKDAIHEGTLGYGDSAIFDPRGVAIAEAGLFTECLIVAQIDPAEATKNGVPRRDALPDRVREQLAAELTGYRRCDLGRAPSGEDRGGQF
jgi:predicted amidohydrolase